MNLGNNKQNNFAVEFISFNYSIMYLSFLFLNYLIKTPLSGSEVKIDPKELWEYPLKERTNSDSDLDTLVDIFKNKKDRYMML
jgi:hypothetical protein